MQINQTIYGLAENWPAYGAYQEAVAATDKLKLACFGFDGETPLTDVKAAKENNRYILEEPWENSISYAALGNFHPLSNIKYYGRTPSTTADHIALINQDQRLTTNFAFGVGGGAGFMPIGIKADYDWQNWTRERWTNDPSWSDSSGLSQFSPFTAIPIKRVVLIPYIVCNNGTWFDGNGDPSGFALFDLKSYLSSTNKADYPNICQIRVEMAYQTNADYDPEEGTGTPIRNGSAAMNTIAIMENLSYGNGLTDFNNHEMDNVFKPLITARGYSGISDSGLTIAGNLSGNILYVAVNTNTFVCPVASGFGLEFDRINNLKIEDYEIQTPYRSYQAFFNCDVSSLTKDEVQEAVRHMVACFGLFFVDGSDDKNELLDSDKMMLGLLDQGVGNGDYTSGLANRSSDQWNMDDVHEIDYDPSNPPEIDPNAYDDGFNFPAAFGLGISGINNRYLLTATNILTLSNTLWDFTKNLQPEEVVDNISQTFLTNNPIDLIVSLQYLPVKDISFGQSSAVKLGRLDLGVSATSVLAANTYDCGYITIFPTFGDNWISKNIRIFAYLPFCGTVEVDLEAAMNHELYLKYLVDTYTGSCTAVLYIINSRKKVVVLNTADGNCITDIPITGIQWETLNANLYNAYQQNKQLKLNNTFGIAKALTGFGTSVGVGDPVGALIGGLNVAGTVTGAMTAEKISDYNLSHTQIPMRAIGGSSGITSNLLDMIPKLLFYRPIDKGTESFIETEGLSCILNGTLSGLQLSGYTEISKIDLNGIAATAAEKDMIRSLLASGVYV